MMLMTKRGETAEEALNKASEKPNTEMFAKTRFPEYLQKPANGSTKRNRTNALMSAQFTLRGLLN